MKMPLFILSTCLLATVLGGCGVQPVETPRETEVTPMETPALPLSTTDGFFVETNQTRVLPEEPQIIRSRFVKVHLDQLLDGTGQPRDVKQIALNLFPDVIYTGIIEQVEENGDSISWSGYLKDVETSYFTMVFTSGVFMGHFASPLGVYESVLVEGDLYRVIMIDQTKFPGGEG